MLLAGLNVSTAVGPAPRLATRSEFLEQFKALITEGVSVDRPISLILANLDHFKAINNQYGHLVGDEILEEVSALLLQRTAGCTAVARIGGDLMAVLQHSALAGARCRARELKDEIAAKQFPRGIRLTASFGVAWIVGEAPFEELLKRAEACLYAAKAKGRDCVVDSDEFDAAMQGITDDPETFDNENKLRVLADRLNRAVLARSRMIAGRFKAEAEHDGLTGLYNRRYFDRRLDRELENARTQSRALSIALLDLDHFGNINRVYGYPTGDKALQTLSEILRNSIRTRDWAARYGGEEFGIVMPDTSVEQALRIADQIRAELEQQVIVAYDGRTFGITASLGIADLNGQPLRPIDFVQRASDKLRHAKEIGRNRVCA